MTTLYEIRDVTGALVAIHSRTDTADGKRMSWWQPDGSPGLNGTPTPSLPLYGSERLAAWPSVEPVVLCEGEKAAQALTDAGIPALGTVTGAATTPSAEVLATLSGRIVALWPDADEPGHKHMDAIAALLDETATVLTVEWPAAPEHGDAADYLAASTADQARELIREAAAWQPPQAPPERPHARPASEIDPAEALADPWVVDGVLRPGRLCVLASREGLGKSRARLELAVRLATGTGALFEHYVIPRRGRVLLFDLENGSEEETRREEEVCERLGLERSALTDYWRVSPDGLALGEAADQDYVRAELETVRPDVVILDSGSSAIGEEWGRELKATVRFLRSLAADYGCAVVVVVHLVKPDRAAKGRKGSEHGTELTDVMGQWTRQADSVALMAATDDDKVLWTMKKRVPRSTLVLAPDDGVFSVVVAVHGAEEGADTRGRILALMAEGTTDNNAIAAALGVTERTVRRHKAAIGAADTMSGPLDGPRTVSANVRTPSTNENEGNVQRVH